MKTLFSVLCGMFLLAAFFVSSAEAYYGTDPALFVYGQNEYERNGIIPIASTDEPVVNVDVHNISDEVIVDVYRSNMQQVLEFLRHDGENKQISDVVNTKNLEKITSISGAVGRVELPVEEDSISLLHVHAGSKSIYTFVVRSHIGTVVKEGDNSLLLWTQDFRTKRSVSGAKVRVYDLEGKVREKTSGSSGDDGVAVVDISDKYDVAVVERDGAQALVPLNLRYLNYGATYTAFSTRSPDERFFTFTDRPIYQPGDKIYFKSILREDDDVRYSIPQGSVYVELYTGWGDSRELVFSKSYEVSKNGTFDGEIQLPENMKTGFYNLALYVGGKKADQYPDSSIGFQIEYFDKPEFGVDVTLEDGQEVIAGDEINLSVQGSFFSGQPLIGETVTYKVTESNYYDELFWTGGRDVSRYKYGYYYGQEVVTDSTTLDQNGHAHISIPASTSEPKTKIYGIEVTVQTESGKHAVEYRNVLVRPADFGIYRKDRNYGGRIGEEQSIQIEIHPFRNVSVDNRTLSVRDHLTWWEKVETDWGVWQKYYRYEKHEEDLENWQVQTNEEGVAELHFTPERSGSHKFFVSGTDDQGKQVEREIYVWVADRDGYYFSSENEKGITIQAESDMYAPGETAQFTIASDVPDRDVFVTFERGYTHRHKVVSLSGRSATFEEKLSDTDMPNMFVTVSSFNDYLLSSSSKDIEVSAESKKLDVTITPNKSQFEPGEKTELTVLVRDNNGNPVQTELTLWAVDKAIFELAEPSTLDIFDAFWKKRYNSTADAHSLMGIGINSAEMGGCFTGDTKVTMADGTEKNIQDIQVGEKVLTRKAELDETLVPAEVVNTYRKTVGGYLTINDTIRVTTNHFLYVNGTWRRADEVNVGDILVQENAKPLTVHSIEWHKEQVDVFNIEVAGEHSYFANGIYVHNGKGGARSVFEDTAYWNPAIQTDKNGVAKVSFTLPDNLTTWAIAAVGSTRDTQVGKNTSEIVVTKNVIVRPQLPRVLYVDDTISLSALVQNFSGEKKTFRVEFAFDNGEVKDSQQEITLDNNESRRIFWETSPRSENEESHLIFSAYAVGEEEMSDGVDLVIPVRRQGYWDTQSFVGGGSHEYMLSLDRDTHPEKGFVELNIASTLVGSLPSAMEYLVRYPYGCIEQTTSRFVPTVIAKENPGLYGEVVENKDVDDMLRSGVERLKTMQNSDGGWGWWGNDQSDPFVTVYVAEYIKRADAVGIPVDASVLNKVKMYFTNGKIVEDDNRHSAYTQVVLQAYGKSLFGLKTEYYITDFPENAGSDIIAYAVMANIRNGYTNPTENGMNHLRSLLKQEGNGMYWDRGSAVRFGSIYTSTGIGLRAFIMGGGDRETINAIVRYLIQGRKDLYWYNTFSTAQVVQALTDYARLERATSQAFSYEVLVGNSVIKTGSLGDSNQYDTVTIPFKDLIGQSTSVEVRTNIDSTASFSSLQSHTYRMDIQDADESRGVAVTRTYTNTKGSDYSIGVGDIVDVTLSLDELDSDARYIVIEDQLPSGLVPINTRLDNETSSGRGDWSEGWGGMREYTENGIIISLPRLYDNIRQFKYQARVVSAGTFVAPPATASLMYEPGIYGRTASTTLKVDEKSVYTPHNNNVDKNSDEAIGYGKLVLTFILLIMSVVTTSMGIWKVYGIWKYSKEKKE